MSEKTELEKKFEELFNDWRSEQENEPDYDYKKTGIAKDSFTIDGIVNEDCWNGLAKKEKKKVLYILREANGKASKMGEYGKRVDCNNFWFQDCINNDKLTHKIIQRIKEMQMIIQKYGSEAKSDKEILREVAYMNLNKRGGGEKVDKEIFNDYIENYKEYIKEEIAIINPDIIVCCGTYGPLIDNICGLYKEGRKKNWHPRDDKDFCYKDAEIKNKNEEVICKATVINMYHPSAYCISKKDYIERFECIYHRAMNDDVKDNSELPVLSKEEICEIVNKMDENTEEFCELCDLISNIEEVYKAKKRKLEADK